MKATKLKSGRYRTQLAVGHDSSGKRIVKSFTADTAWEAEKMALDYKASYGIGMAQKDITVEAALNQYIESRTNTASPVTIRTYRLIRDTRLQSIMGIKISQLRRADVQQAVNIDAAKLSEKSLKEAVSLLSSALSFQDIETNLRKKITFPKSRRKKKILPPAERIMEIIVGTKYEMACLLAIWLSLRISEVRGLKYSDISADGRWLSVQRSIVYSDGIDIHNDFNKTEESTRTIPLPKTLYDKIMAQPHSSDDEYIVPLGYNCIYKGFKKLMAQNGYDMTFHNLRAEFATTLNSMGIPDRYIQSLGGWSNPTTMHKHYVQTLTSEEQKYQNKVNDYFDRLLNDSVSSGQIPGKILCDFV